MQRNLTIDYLQDYIASKSDVITKHRPDCFYVPRPPVRRKYDTAIRAPDRGFFKLMTTSDVYLWIVVKRDAKSNQAVYQKIQQCFKCVKTLIGYEQLPICETFEECMHWIRNFPTQIVLFEDIFDQVFERLNLEENACGFHIISPANAEIAKAARHNRKIKNIYDDQVQIFGILKQNMERVAITKETQEKIEEEKTFKNQRAYIRNVIFPNFIKLSKHQKAAHQQYRLNLIGLRKLKEGDLLASKDKFIDHSREKFPDDEELIQQYNSNNFEVATEILRFYTLDCFFYRVLNNTLRIAKNTEQFFSVGEPFNKVFDAIKQIYDSNQKDQNLVVYRGADLTNSECTYLEENVGKYIEINGFISTSKSFNTAKSFAKDRKSNTIFKIKFCKATQKYKQFDNGYVDLELNKCSAYDEDEVLFNALNVFKILGKEKIEGFDVYVLEYGTIFQILEKDPTKLEQNDKFAYYSFRELRQMIDEVKDIGDVYIRTLQPEKAIEIYEFKLEKLKESLDPSKTKEYEETLVKAADAYLSNGQPDKALKYYESMFKAKKKKKVIRRNTYDQPEEKKVEASQILQISTKVSEIQASTDKFEDAELQFKETMTEINTSLGSRFDIDIFWKKIENANVMVSSKRTQMLFEEEFQLLNDIKKDLEDALKNIVGLPNEEYQRRKIYLMQTQIFAAMTESSSHSETGKQRIPKIKIQFDAVSAKLAPIIQKNSYEEGLINSRMLQITRRISNSNETVNLEALKSNISKVVKHTSETDQKLPELYKSLAESCKSLKTPDYEGALQASRKQQKHETLIYGQSDPRPLNTKMAIAIIERDDKNTMAALEQFSAAYHTQIFKQQTKFMVHAKILFNMSQAYTDKGEDGLALKSLQQAYDILEIQLSKNDFNKSVLRFKIRLRMGRIYTSTSLRTQGKLKLAEDYLMEYHGFITKIYNYPHTDVAMSHNCLGALYSITRRFDKCKKQFVKAIDIYSETTGQLSVEVARMKSNLAVCHAHLKDTRNAAKVLLDAKAIFQKIYKDMKKSNPFEHQYYFIQAEIESLQKKHKNAIESCETSKQLQKQFLESKKRYQTSFFMSEFLPATKNQSFMSKIANNGPQVKSGIVKLGNDGIMNSMMPNKLKSENYGPMNSLMNYTTQHGLKCEIHICECLIYLKEFKEALSRLEILKNTLTDRITKEAINPLFKDNVFSKKKFYLQKCKNYIADISKKMDKKGRFETPAKVSQNDQNSKEQPQQKNQQQPQINDNFI